MNQARAGHQHKKSQAEQVSLAASLVGRDAGLFAGGDFTQRKEDSERRDARRQEDRIFPRLMKISAGWLKSAFPGHFKSLFGASQDRISAKNEARLRFLHSLRLRLIRLFNILQTARSVVDIARQRLARQLDFTRGKDDTRLAVYVGS